MCINKGEKMKKRIILLLIIIFIALIIIFIFNNGNSISIRINWGQNFPEPDSIDRVFHGDGKDSDEFEIWLYSKKDTVDLNNLELITDENIVEAKRIFKKYEDNLESEDALRSFREHFDAENKIKVGAYYKKVNKSEDNSYLLLYYDPEEGKLYYMAWMI